MTVTVRDLGATPNKNWVNAGNDPRTGVQQVGQTVDTAVSQSLSRFQEQVGYVLDHLNGGMVRARSTSGLDVTVKGLTYTIVDTEYTLPDDDSFTCTDDASNYLYVDGDQIVEKSTTGWPGTPHRKLAKVICAAGAISSIVNAQHANHRPGMETNWSEAAATQDVDLAGNELLQVERIDFSAATQVQIVSGAIAYSAHAHYLESETGAQDTLTTITAEAGRRRVLLLFAASGHQIQVVSTGNINLINGDSILVGDTGQALFLYQDTDTSWLELTRNQFGNITLTSLLDAAGFAISDLGPLDFEETTATIATGSFAQTSCLMRVDTEAAASSDDLDSVTPASGVGTGLLILRPAVTGRTVVAKHASAVNKFSLANDRDFEMTTKLHTLVCLRDSAGKWIEWARSPMKAADLANTGFGVPLTMDWFIGGTLATGVVKKRWIANHAGKIVRTRVYADTAPTGQAIIVDTRINGSSIWASQGDMAQIADGANSGASSIKSPPASYNAGDIIDQEIEQVGSGTAGADLTVTLEAYAELAVPPS